MKLFNNDSFPTLTSVLKMGRRKLWLGDRQFKFYHFSKIFLNSAHCLRLTVPLGLNMCPPFHSITKSERPQSILPPARTVIEDETRRNAFWLAYATERQHGCGNGWALSVDDQDVSQLLPVRGDQFDQGVCFLCILLIGLNYAVDPCDSNGASMGPYSKSPSYSRRQTDGFFPPLYQRYHHAL